eukprot:gb/GECH01006273.1/.p1 GENE.gb/GECH01006273.1/~~gb/GECH01006273.1/.p1  ORF type:complete len:149 (+),score=34.82 gb/GECH01006273.1/:1-447(+)
MNFSQEDRILFSRKVLMDFCKKISKTMWEEIDCEDETDNSHFSTTKYVKNWSKYHISKIRKPKRRKLNQNLNEQDMEEIVEMFPLHKVNIANNINQFIENCRENEMDQATLEAIFNLLEFGISQIVDGINQFYSEIDNSDFGILYKRK